MEKSDLLKPLGKRIQELRVSKGYSQVDLAGEIEGSTFSYSWHSRYYKTESENYVEYPKTVVERICN